MVGEASFVIDRDKVCIYKLASDCNGLAETADHVLPISAGGITKTSNMVACCYQCNHYKGADLNPNYLLIAFLYLKEIGENKFWEEDIIKMRTLYRQVEFTCIPCGKSFIRKHFNQKFCSNTCRQRAFRVGRGITE